MFPLSPHKPERNTSVASTFPMPTLPTKSTQPNHNQFKQKTSAETINETKRMLANGKLISSFAATINQHRRSKIEIVFSLIR